jgi:hypothetical protein
LLTSNFGASAIAMIRTLNWHRLEVQMTFPTWRKPFAALFFGMVAFLASAAAHADPPYRVARLAYESGSVSFSPAGEDEWSRASINRPLITGDRLWVDAGSRAELQIDGGALRIGDQTSLALLNVDDRIVQAQLTQGDLELRVWRLDPNQTIEIDTPNLAAVISRPGAYRIGVDEKSGSTQVTVRSGDVTLYGEGNAFRIAPGDSWEFYDTALRDYDNYQPSAPDDLQRFAMSRDRRWEQSVSARYVSRELIGFQELDDNGTWRQVPDYGWVWTPSRVSADWAPYREGHWAWVDPWGWTWVDNEPWGFAPFHYGRWAFVQSRWCWVPGPRADRPVYAPALVAFIGGGAGAIGWFPLGPREVYRPAYHVSREYFTRVNVSNTAINVAQVNNFYQRRDDHDVHYSNQHVPGAVIAVAAAAFTQSKPVAREIVHIQTQNAAAQPVMMAAPVAPAKQSVLGPQPAQHKPPEHAFSKQVVAQTPPPAPKAPIESKLPALREHPGQPLAPGSAPAHVATPGAPAAPAPSVKVVPATKPAAAPPPPAPAANRPPHERRGAPERMPARAAASAPSPAHGPAAASAPAAAGQQQRREEERGRRDERQRERPPLAPNRPTPAPAPAPATPPVAVPVPAAPAPAAPSPQPRREDRREEQGGPPAAQPAPPAAPQQQHREQVREQPSHEAAPARPQPAPPPAAVHAPAPQAAPAAQPPAPPPAVHPAPQRAEPRPEQRGEQRRDAASEARHEREQRRDERKQ